MLRRRRIGFRLLVSLSVILFVEGASLVALWLIEGEPTSWAEVDALRRERRHEFLQTHFERDSDIAEAFRPEVVHPYLGYVLSPDVAKNASQLGFPGPESPIRERSPDTLIVALMGGSVAVEVYDNSRALLVEALGASTAVSGRRVELVNLALPGYKQPQQLMALNYLLVLGASFDVVVNLDGFNEVALHAAENGGKGVFHAFPRSWFYRAQDLSDPAAIAMLGEIAHLRAERKRWARLMGHTPMRYSLTASLVWRVRDRRLTAAIADGRQILLAHDPQRHGYQFSGPRLDPPDAEGVMRELVSVWSRSSEQMSALARANGIAYFHFLQPNQYVPGSKTLTSAERRDAYDESHPYSLSAMQGYALLREEGVRLRERGVAFRDLTAIYADVTESIYTDTCCHVNQRGTDLIALAIAETVAEGLAAEGSGPRAALAP